MYLREENLREIIECMFFAYRDLTSKADEILKKDGYGRAHHRVIYFVNKHPGISVGNLLSILSITKQSLARVLRQLIADGLVERINGQDQRIRLLYLSDKGKLLEEKLTNIQCKFIAQSYKSSGINAVFGFREVLKAMAHEQSQQATTIESAYIAQGSNINYKSKI